MNIIKDFKFILSYLDSPTFITILLPLPLPMPTMEQLSFSSIILYNFTTPINSRGNPLLHLPTSHWLAHFLILLRNIFPLSLIGIYSILLFSLSSPLDYNLIGFCLLFLVQCTHLPYYYNKCMLRIEHISLP